MQSWVVNDAAEYYDSQVLDELLNQRADAERKKRPVYANSAYRAKDREEGLAAKGVESQIHEKAMRGYPLSEEQ